MYKLLSIKKILKKLYWLGCIGVIGTLFDIRILELFYMFFLLAILDFILSLVIVLKSDSKLKEVSDLKFLFQNLGMLVGIPIIYIRNSFCLPNIKNYTSSNYYMLPFNDEWLVVNGGIDKVHSHSWRMCNQRYAYDFFIVIDGLSHDSDGTDVKDYYCYEKPIIAPADGTVVELKNYFEDTPVTGKSEIKCTASDVRGNYIVIKHDNGEYSTIAHIKKNSFLVNIGDKVKQRQEIAKCGNSGNTSEPHIHFQIQKGQSFLFNASLPIYFDSIETSINESIHYLTAGQLVKNRI